MKENKNRIIFWFIIMVIFIGLGVYGRSSFNQGYGSYGKLKKALEPYAVEFNTLDDIKTLTNLRAEVTKEYLVVTYTNEQNKKEKFNFEYNNNGTIETLTNTDSVGSEKWEFIARHMADAVYHANGGKGSIFDDYEYETFITTNIDDGLVINTTTKTITLNLGVNVTKKIAGKYPSLKDNIYAKEEDLVTLVNDLTNNNYFSYVNKDIKIYVKNTSSSYDIYASLNEENATRTFKSIANIIKLLKPNVYQTLEISENGEVNFDSDNNYYLVQRGVTFSEANIFSIEDNIYELSLFK